MIDIHNHILFDTDDGSQSIDESIKILKNFELHGYTDIIVTPHFIRGVYTNDVEMNRIKLDKLIQSVKMNKINISLHLGNEVYLEDGIEKLIKSEKIATLNNSRYILIEKPRSSRVASFEIMMMELRNKGYIPIIAHPERYSYIKNDIEVIERWISHGMLMQMNLNSLNGFYGSHAKKLAIKLLENNLIHFVSTDIHSSKTDFSTYINSLEKVQTIVGKETFDIITKYNQRKILSDELILPFPFKENKKICFFEKMKIAFNFKY